MIAELGAIAEYKDQLLSDYQGNPLIEALPPILLRDEFVERVTEFPAFDKSEKQLPPEVRLHCLDRLETYFQPLDLHIALEQKLSRLIRRGYVGRNPLSPQFAFRFRQINKLLEQARQKNGLQIGATVKSRSTASGYSLVGLSGMGKSTAIERILKLYPQVVVHGAYRETPLNFYQIVWLKIDCPHAGSLKGICNEFFIAIDELIGTNYAETYSLDRRISEDIMLAQMCLIAFRHGLGVLVIDELQNLSLAKSGGAEKAMNFFVKLVNNIGLPVVKIGTNKARKVFQADLRHGRRSIGQEWDRFKIADERDCELWNLLMEELFEYQWTTGNVKFTPEFCDVLYEESQGITDIAIKLYTMAQGRAIIFGEETITPDDVRIVAEENLKMIQPMLYAIRTNNLSLIDKYGDIKTDELEEQVKKYFADLEAAAQKDRAKALKKAQSIITNVPAELGALIKNLMALDISPAEAKYSAEQVLAHRLASDTPDDLLKKAYSAALDGITALHNPLASKTETPNTKKQKPAIQSPKDLRLIVSKAKENKRPAYEGLKEANVIKPPLQDILFEEAA